MDETADLLESLSDASLLEEVGVGRYGFHDLLHIDARRRAEETEPPVERTAALERMLTWYLWHTASADVVLMPGRWRLNDDYQRLRADGATQTRESAWEWLEAERVNLLSCVRTAGRTVSTSWPGSCARRCGGCTSTGITPYQVGHADACCPGSSRCTGGAVRSGSVAVTTSGRVEEVSPIPALSGWALLPHGRAVHTRHSDPGTWAAGSAKEA